MVGTRRQASVQLVHRVPASVSPVPAAANDDATEDPTDIRNVKAEPFPTQLAGEEPPSSTQRSTLLENIAIENLGRGVKELVQAINKIEQLGITKVAGDTPKIVVIGDQSTGKSSVINAISGIQVPRSTGTCTRCPMQITLTANQAPNAKWKSEVSLRREYYFDPGRNEGVPEGDLSYFYPWEEQDTPDVIHFKTVYDKRELQNVIFQAQVATLNPGSDPNTFVPMQTGSQPPQPIVDVRGEVEFSPNLVCLDISAPGLPNLSFYDLPGVISQTDSGQNRYLIKLVKRLVKKYIAKDNALVLLACSMESDIQNSNAAGILRKHGAIDRTLGILTKPDRLPRGDPPDRWERILKGELFGLGHGYHVVKNPSQMELDQGVDHARARALEKEFFSSIKPWCDRFESFSDRYGAERLQEKLSQMLAIQILQSLPTIHDRVQQQLMRIDGELAHIPEPPTSDAVHIVLEAINKYADKVSKQMEGEFPENQFRLAWKSLRGQLRDGITAQRPTMMVKTGTDVQAARNRANSVAPQHTPNPNRRDIINLDSDNESPGQPTPSKKRKHNSSTPSQRGQIGNEFTKRFELDQLRQNLDDMSSSDIPNEIDPKAVNELRRLTVQNWAHPTKAFFDGLNTALKNTLNACLDDTMRAWKTTELCRETAKLTESLLDVALREQRDMVAPRALKLEQHKPMTENAQALEFNEKKELEVFQNARITARTNIYFDELDRSTGRTTSKAERMKKCNDLTFRTMLGPDPFAREVEAMAKIRGYYNVASMRFVDHVCMSVQVELFEKLRVDLKSELITVLGIVGEHGPDTCIRLLAEDPAREIRRRTLQADKEKLRAALECLQQLDSKYRQGIPIASSQASPNDRNGAVQNGRANGSGATPGPSRQVVAIDAMDMDEA